MLPRLRALGYREVMSMKKRFIGRGAKIRGHEFHYSEIYSPPGAKTVDTAYLIEGSAKTKRREGYCYKYCLGSYLHLHFGSNANFALGFVTACRGIEW